MFRKFFVLISTVEAKFRHGIRFLLHRKCIINRLRLRCKTEFLPCICLICTSILLYHRFNCPVSSRRNIKFQTVYAVLEKRNDTVPHLYRIVKSSHTGYIKSEFTVLCSERTASAARLIERPAFCSGIKR